MRPAILIILLLLLAVLIGGFVKVLCLFRKELKNDNPLAEKINALPVLKSEAEISAAIAGEPRDYLIENYKFTDEPTASDTITNFILGNYLCVKVVKYVFTIRAWIRRGKYYTTNAWEFDSVQYVCSPLHLCGAELENVGCVDFDFGYVELGDKFSKSNVNPNKREYLFVNQYYPDGVYDFKKVGRDFVEKLNPETLSTYYKESLLSNRGYKYSARYGYQTMKAGDRATFAAHLGNGHADLKVFDGRNRMAVNGGKKALYREYNSLAELILHYFKLFLWVAVMITISVLIFAVVLQFFDR